MQGRELRVGLTHEPIQALHIQTPPGRVGNVADAAGTIYLFCIPEFDFFSGEVLPCACISAPRPLPAGHSGPQLRAHLATLVGFGVHVHI